MIYFVLFPMLKCKIFLFNHNKLIMLHPNQYIGRFNSPWFHKLFSGISLNLLFSLVLFGQSNEIVVFNKVVESSSISSSRLQTVSNLSGNNFKFISKNSTFSLSKISNNVEGTLEYFNSGSKISITGIIEGKFVSSGNNIGLYFRSYSLSPEKYFALVIPSYESNADFVNGQNPQYNSSGPYDALAALKTTQTQAGSIVASISDPAAINENGGTTVTFTLNFNLSRTSSASISFTPTLVAGTATSGSDYSTTFQYSTDNVSFSNVSGAISVSETTNNIYLRASILDDSTPESSETFFLYTNSFSGTGSSQLANSSGVVGMATILDDADAYIWNGSTSNDWSVSSNWTPNNSGHPSSSDNAKIPSGTPNSAQLSSNSEIHNLQILSGATVTLTTNNLTINGDLEHNGTLSGSGNSGKVTLTGSGSASQISGTGYIDNLELNNTNGANIASGTLTLNNGYYPTSGILTTNGNLVFNSDASQTATVFAKSGSCSTYISGNVTVKRYIDVASNTTFRFLGHPFAENKLLSSFTNLPVTNTYRYNSIFVSPDPNASNGDPAWVKLGNSDTWSQNSGIISLMNNASAFTISASGPINQCTVTIPLNAVSNNDANLGWVLIANPFASYLDLSYKSTISDTGVQNGYYVWDVSTNTVDAGSQKTRQSNFNHKGKYMTIISGVRSAGTAQRIAPFGCFFVQMTPGSGTVSGTITITESDKTTNKGTEYTPFSIAPIGSKSNNITSFKTIADESVSINTLSILNQDIKIDDFKLIFRNGGSNQYDRFDLSKMHNSNLDIFTKIPQINTDIAVDTRSFGFENFKIPIYLKSNLNIELEPFALHWKEENQIEADYFLYDQLNKDRVKLENNKFYQFTGGNFNQNEPRFYLEVFEKSADIPSEPLSISPNPSSDRIYIHLNNSYNVIDAIIYDSVGQEISKSSFSMQQFHEPSINIENLKSGNYILKIITDKQEVFTKKIFKK